MTRPFGPGPAAFASCWLLLALGGAPRSAEAGHEAAFYPSFYPQEIRIETVDATAAAARLQTSTLHAYVDGDPFDGRALPRGIGMVESLGSYLVATMHGGGDEQHRCGRAERAVGALGAAAGDFTFHPYPVTPYDADYLQHVDLVARARARYPTQAARDSTDPPLRVFARGALAERVSGSRWRSAEPDADVTVEEVDVRALLGSKTTSLDGWSGPPWIKRGWFRAYLLLAGQISDPSARRAVEGTYARLVGGGYRDLSERLTLERALVTRLTRGCERVVVGYTVRREAFSADYSEGIENVGADSLTGLNSAIFVRTAKLKDFPWNGWLRVGIGTPPAAAFNPIAGFTDAAGRLVWAALGDPALLPVPQGAGWIANRVSSTRAARGSARVAVPPDAVIPEPGTGALRPVGRGTTARVKLVYRVLASAFHDGSRMNVADILYPFAFAYRWGAGSTAAASAHDPVVEASTAIVRDRLAGLRVSRVETVVRDYGEDLKYSYDVPVVEVYLRHGSTDPEDAAAVAPPWTTVPWHVIALMEEAVKGGLAAFSEPEAARRGVRWLDLVRGPALDGRLASLADRLHADGYIPEALIGRVSQAEARERWAALARFYERHGHFLVTNGPYRLVAWSPDAVTLEVFRDRSYPLGVGAFDRYPIPRRAYFTRIQDRGGRLEIRADVETVSRYERTYEVVREPLRRAPAHADDHHVVVCRFVVVGSNGAVADAGGRVPRDDGGFDIPLGGLRPGAYTILIALYLDDNAVSPEVRMIEHRVRARP